MQLRMFFVGLLFSSIALAGNEAERPQSVSVLNLSGKAVDLWVNGEYRLLRAGVAMLQPCLPGEKVEVQISVELSQLACGETKEIAK
jgi:hypothetical protein